MINRMEANMRLSELFSENTGQISKNRAKLNVDETAGVGIYDPRSNKTADVGPNTLKKNARAFDFDVTQGGVPPTLNPDGTFGTKRKKKVKK